MSLLHWYARASAATPAERLRFYGAHVDVVCTPASCCGQATHSAAAVTAMRAGITRVTEALVGASVVLGAALVCAGAAGADPSQQDQFVALLEQEQIPPIDNLSSLVARAHQICGQLDGGTPVDNVVNDEMNFAFGDNPALHLRPDRVRRTAIRFITASVEVYCPSHHGELPPYE